MTQQQKKNKIVSLSSLFLPDYNWKINQKIFFSPSVGILFWYFFPSHDGDDVHSCKPKEGSIGPKEGLKGNQPHVRERKKKERRKEERHDAKERDRGWSSEKGEKNRTQEKKRGEEKESEQGTHSQKKREKGEEMQNGENQNIMQLCRWWILKSKKSKERERVLLYSLSGRGEWSPSRCWWGRERLEKTGRGALVEREKSSAAGSGAAGTSKQQKREKELLNGITFELSPPRKWVMDFLD